MRIRNREEHKWVISLLDELSSHNKQVISRNKLRDSLSSEDYQRLERHLGDYLDDKNSVYLYTKQDEVYFQVRFRNQIFTSFDEYDDAKNLYSKLKKGLLQLDEVKGKRIKTPTKKPQTVTLEDGYKRMLEKHMNEYNAGNVKYSSYTKKDTTIKYHILPYFSGKPLCKITETDIERFVDQIRYHELSKKHKKGEEKRLSVAMQDEVLMYFKKLFKTTRRWFGVKTYIDIDDLMDDIDDSKSLKKARKRYSKEVEVIIDEVYEKALNSLFPTIKELENGIYNPVYGIMLMIYFTGMRIDEVIALTPKDFDPKTKTLSISKSISWHPNKNKTKKSYEVTTTKTWDERAILLPDSICEYLETYINRLKELSYYSDDMFIFSRLSYARTENELLYPFSLKTFSNHMNEVYVHSGLIKEGDKIPKNHTARHAFNTLLKNNHIEEYDRKIYLGHSPGSGVNEGYTHKSKEEEKRIVEIADKFCRNFVEGI